MHTIKNHSITGKSLLLFLAAGMGSMLLFGCTSQIQQPSMEMLFSPTPTLTLTPTIQWFPVTATPALEVVPTATPNPAAQPRYGSVIYSDLTDTGKNWIAAQDANGSVSVKDDSITLVVNTPKGMSSIFRKDTVLGDFYFESIMTVGLCKKDDQAGVIFREAGQQSYYRFLVNCQGMISLQQVVGGAPTILKDWSLSNQVKPGLSAPIKIGIWASGKTLRVYLNDELQLETSSGTFYSGGIGFTARAAADTPVTVNFSGVKVFEVVK
jgi:hypothetical protein